MNNDMFNHQSSITALCGTSRLIQENNMDITITLQDGASFVYSNLDIRTFEFNALDNSVYFEFNLATGGYDNHAFVNVQSIVINK
jgi:hypothetical protein